MAKEKFKHSSMSAYDLLIGDDSKMAVITGHLLLEAMLAELLDIQGQTGIGRMRFAKKVDEAIRLDILGEQLAAPIRSLNRLRNQVAHEIGFEVTHDQLFDLTREFALAGIDFSDETIHDSRELSAEWYGKAGCLIECIGNTYMHLALIADELGHPEFLA